MVQLVETGLGTFARARAPRFAGGTKFFSQLVEIVQWPVTGRSASSSAASRHMMGAKDRAIPRRRMHALHESPARRPQWSGGAPCGWSTKIVNPALYVCDNAVGLSYR